MMTYSVATGRMTTEIMETVNRELTREFESLLESLVVAAEHGDHARMSFAYERLKDRYLKVLECVRIDTLVRGRSDDGI